MLQDIKNDKPVKLKILSAFLILRKKNKITNIFNRVNTDLLIISLSVKGRHRKKITAWKTECEDKRVAG